jgi:two-component system chemotaxis sensor kinase CheA
LLPLVLLRDLLNLPPIDDTGEYSDRFVVVAQVGGRSFGIIVDRVFDAEEIVVKPLAPILRNNHCYAGNTILGDGSVIMILDPNGISQAAGEADPGEGASLETGNRVEAQRGADAASFLLFRAGDSALKAVPLELVTRLENVQPSAIEPAGAGHAVQYRGALMPIVAFNPAHDWYRNDKQPVLVFEDAGRAMGLAVDKIVDVVRDEFNVELRSDDEGLVGSAVIAGQTVDIVNIGSYLSRATEALNGYNEAVPHDKPERELLIVYESRFLCHMMLPILASSNWRVTAVSNAQEALALREAGRKFALILCDAAETVPDGRRLIEEIQDTPEWAATPVLGISPGTEQVHTPEGFAAQLDRSNLAGLKSSLLRTIATLMADEALGMQARRAS